MKKYKVTIELSRIVKADGPEEARVALMRLLDAGEFDEQILLAKVEEVNDRDHQG